ncbi:MAG TPA: metal-dependent hydrolase [Candidatus Dormibacteraeota bacterium]|nr:metal-dependent hydrolase [Candidatus Dormibacteraeota bacterium]
MLGYSHVVIGAVAGVAVARALHGDLLAGALVGGVAGLAPDVDTPGSIVGRRLPRWWHRMTPGHRGLTHSLAWCLALGMVAYGVEAWALGEAPGRPLFAAVVVAGSLSHLLADGLTEEGVPLLWPLSRRRVVLAGVLAFRTGSWLEHVVTATVAAGALYWLYDPACHDCVERALAGLRGPLGGGSP